MKVTQQVDGRRYLLGYRGTVADATKHVDLADLVEVIHFPTIGPSGGRQPEG